MKLPKMTFNEDDRGLYCSNAQCRDAYVHDHASWSLFSIDDCKVCFNKSGFDLYLVGKLKGNFPTLKTAINFARNYDVPVEMIEFYTLQETTRNSDDESTSKAPVYQLLDTEGMDSRGSYDTIRDYGGLYGGYYPCKVVDLYGTTKRQNY